MTLTEQIQENVVKLPIASQEEVLNFVEYLIAKLEREEARKEAASWTEFSLASAIRGMEDEESPYTLADLKVVFS